MYNLSKRFMLPLPGGLGARAVAFGPASESGPPSEVTFFPSAVPSLSQRLSLSLYSMRAIAS